MSFDLHVHTTFSDGKNTPEEIVLEAIRRGMDTIGFSDHSLGYEIPCAATAFGSCVIEKHFTLDKSKIGMDNQMAAEPDVFKRMIECCENVACSLGSRQRIISDKEKEMLLKLRRSIIAKKNLPAGKLLEFSDFDYKRPGYGIAPSEVNKLIGKRLVKDVKADCMIRKEYIEWL